MTEWCDAQGSPQSNISRTPLFLTIDQGGHASRVLVFDQSGCKIMEAWRAVDVSHPQPEWVEQDAEALVKSVQSALDEVIEKLGKHRHRIVAAGLVTQRSNIVCWDRHTGRALSPAISWQDRRAHRWMQAFKQHTSKIRRITGLLPSAHYGVSKIHWCLEQLKDVAVARAQGTLACGPLASFLLFRLLKERPCVVDSVNASRTLLWDRELRDWSDELLTMFSLEAEYLPRCVPNQYEFGTLPLVDFSVPLTVCSGDQSAALFSSGMPEAGRAYLNMGTGAFMQCLSKGQKKSPLHLLQSVVWDEPGESLQVLEATINGAGSALAVVEKELGLSSEMAQSQYAFWLETVKNIPLYLNGVAGLGSPFWRPDFVSRFVGDNVTICEPEEKLVAVMESILFLVKVNLQELRDESAKVHCIVVSGGLSVLDGLCQRLADLSGLMVVRPRQSEATAKGLAFLLARGLKEPQVKQLPGKVEWAVEDVAENKADEFVPADDALLIERYRKWRIALDVALNEGVGL